jgi:hypothetical protein
VCRAWANFPLNCKLSEIFIYVLSFDHVHNYPLEETENAAMNANKPHKGQLFDSRGREQEKVRRSTKTETSRAGEQETRKLHARHRRQMGNMHEARPQTTNSKATRKAGPPSMKLSPSTVSHRTATNYFTGEMLLVWVGFVTAASLLILFGLDLAVGWPFMRASLLMDISFTVCGLILGYLSWNAYRDLV